MLRAATALVLMVPACGPSSSNSAPPAEAPAAAAAPARPSPRKSDIDDATVEIREGPISPSSPDDWLANVRAYEERAHKTTSVEQRVVLGRWAYDNGLEDEAWEQFALAMQDAKSSLPDVDAYARRAMGIQDAGAGAVVDQNAALVDQARVNRIKDMGLAFSFVVAIEDDAPPEFFEDLRWRLRRMNWFFWRVTHGQMFLDELTLEDKSSQGRFIIEAGKLEATLLSGGGAFCANAGREDWKVVSAGRVYTRVLAHEMLHGVFGLPDERHGCACIMQGGLYGIRSDQLGMCDDDTHRPAPGNEASCWTLASDRYPALQHPSPAPWGAPPEPKFTVRDR